MPGTLHVHAAFELRDLHQDLEALELGLGREVTEAVLAAGGTVLLATERLTPYDPSHDDHRADGLPHMRDTFDVRTAGPTVATIGSTHPGAAVNEFGGTISPKGTPIRIREAGMARKAGELEAPRFERDLAQRLDALARRHGL